MIVKPFESTIPVPGNAADVAQVILVHERQEKISMAGAQGPVLMVRPGSATGVIKRSTALMRLREMDMRARQKIEPELFGMPTYWCPLNDGKIELWPTPNCAYDIEIMSRTGKPLMSNRAPVQVFPVEAHVEAMRVANDDAERRAGTGQRVERFTLAPEEGE